MKNRRANFNPLTDAEIRELAMRLCGDDDPDKAEALLVLASDMYQRQILSPKECFPFYVVREVAFSQLGNSAMDARAAVLRDTILPRKGGAE